MIAEVIPLRRRPRDGAWQPGEAEPSHSGVFDPPPEPEPPEGYSVWDRPTAELVRRQPPDRLVAVHARGHSWASVVRARGAALAAGVAALIAIAALVVATGGLNGGLRPAASTDAGGGEIGLGAQLGGLPASSQPLRSRHAAAASRHTPTPRTKAHTATAHSSAQAAVVAAPAETAPSSRTYVSAQVAAPRAGAPAHSEAPTATAASREFGFER
jgi:hypothetical protein